MYTIHIIEDVIHTFYLYIDDTSRCRLSFIPGVEGSDYINANYIDVCYTSNIQYHTTKEITKPYTV